MPPKKKQPPPGPNKEDEVPIDVFMYIDTIQDCLDVADRNESFCLNGISKASVALKQTSDDPDIQCIVQIKRAELLYIAVKSEYNIDELVDQPLDSCIEDCEQVLSKVSSANGSGKLLCEQASTLLRDALQLKKTLQKEARAKRTQHKSVRDKPSYSVFQRYDPTKALFKHISKINAYLLQDIVECYKKSKNICRTCYYRHNRIEQLSVPNRHCKNCKKAAMPLLLIPASKMCDNLADSQAVAIPPPPKMLMSKQNRHKPFQMCKNKDHSICRNRSAEGDNWFGHSIEELVVWTVERHYGCKFSEYVRSHHTDSEPPNHQLFIPVTGATNGETSQLDEFDNDYDEEEFDYYPEDCMFKNVAGIPQPLLLDVMELYSRSKDYCKWCYYKDNKKSIVKFDKTYNSTMCSSCGNKWDPVVVMPASEHCWNFGNFDHLPIGPWPKGKPIKDSFEYCQKKDHFRCFRVYIESEFWYPHSVEEMVVWTVERERECSFSAFIESVSRIPDSLIRTSPKTTTLAANPTQATKTVSSTTPTNAAQRSPISNKAHPGQRATSVSPTPAPFPSHPMLARRVPPGTIAMPMAKPAVTSVSKSVAQLSPKKQELGHARAGAVIPQQGSAINNSLTKQIPTHVAVSAHHMGGAPVTNNNVNGAYVYPSNSVPGMTDVLKGAHGYVSSIQEFRPGGTIQVTTIGVTMTTSPGGVFGSATLTASAIPSTAFQYPVRSFPNYRAGSVTYEVQSSHTPLPAVISPTSTAVPAGQVSVYKFSEVNFKTTADIPVALLKAISACFQTKKEVCRLCFYEERVLSELVQATNTCANSGHPWLKPLLVIKGCTLCDNEPCFERGESVPIPPLPPVATIKKCSQKNHHKCYTKSLKSNEMFAHSVEAFVVWIVESEKECSFEEYAVQTEAATVSSPPPSTTGAVSRTPPPSVPRHVSSVPVSPRLVVQPRNPTPPPPLRTTPPPPLRTTPPPPLRTTPPPPRTIPRVMGHKGIFHPRDVVFSTMADIPRELLASVAECFKSHAHVCRVCFFDSGCKNRVQKVEVNRIITCPYGHNPWREIKVIPKSRLCVSPSDWIPVPPLPKHMKQSRNPFLLCKKPDHSVCYVMSKGTNPWFPHTVEEMVIWTVERENDKRFEDVYQQFLPAYTPAAPVTANRPSQLNQPMTATQAQPGTFVTTRTVSHSEPKSQPSMTANQYASLPHQKTTSATPKPGSGAQTTSIPAAVSVPSQTKPPVTTQAPLTIPLQATAPLTNFEVQSPTMKMDLDEAIKLAYRSPSIEGLPPKTQSTLSSNTNNMFGAFPNLLTNILPESNGTNGQYKNNSGSLDIASFGRLPDHSLGLFPALFGGSEFSLNSGNPFVTTGNLSGLGGHRENTPVTYELPVSTALHGWMSAPTTSSTGGSHDTTTSSTGGSHDTQQMLNTNQSGRRVTQDSPQNTAKSFTGQSALQPKAAWSSQPPKAAQQSKNAAAARTNGPLPLPRMPISEPLVLEKAFEAEGFTTVKSKRNKKRVDGPSLSVFKQSPKPQKLPTPRFTGLDLDSSNSDTSSDESKSGPSEGNRGSSSTSNIQASGEASAVGLGTTAQLDTLKQSTDISNGLPTSNGISGDLSEQLSDAFEPQLNGVVSETLPSFVTPPSMTSEGGDSDELQSAVDMASVCLVCYKAFADVELLLVHCRTESHCSTVAVTTGGKKLPKCAPPCLKTANMKLCKKHLCNGAPACKLAHSQQQLTSWKQEWASIRKMTTLARGVDTMSLPLPVRMTELNRGLCLSQNTVDSQYPGLVVSLSRPSSVTVQSDHEDIEWSISLQGQNWQTLFGVYCHTPPLSNSTPSLNEPVFKVKSVSSGPRTISTDSPVWEAESVSSGFLLGRVVVCVLAQVSSLKSGGKEKCELRFNLGFKEFLFLPMILEVEGESSLPSPEEVQPAVDVMNDQPSFSGLAQEDTLKPFVPQHKWDLSHGSSSSEELGLLNMEGEDTTLQHVPIEDWGCSLTEDTSYLK